MSYMYMYIQLTSSAGQSKANNADTNQTSVHIRHISADKRLHQIECIRQRKNYFVIHFDSFTLWGIVVKKKKGLLGLKKLHCRESIDL